MIVLLVLLSLSILLCCIYRCVFFEKKQLIEPKKKSEYADEKKSLTAKEENEEGDVEENEQNE